MWYLPLLLLSPALSVTQDKPAQESQPQSPIELGRVNWATTLEPALAASAKDQKPVLLLFQEIPG